LDETSSEQMAKRLPESRWNWVVSNRGSLQFGWKHFCKLHALFTEIQTGVSVG
jgi:hypothetical protein